MEVALQVAGRVFVDTTPIDKVLQGAKHNQRRLQLGQLDVA